MRMLHDAYRGAAAACPHANTRQRRPTLDPWMARAASGRRGAPRLCAQRPRSGARSFFWCCVSIEWCSSSFERPLDTEPCGRPTPGWGAGRPGRTRPSFVERWLSTTLPFFSPLNCGWVSRAAVHTAGRQRPYYKGGWPVGLWDGRASGAAAARCRLLAALAAGLHVHAAVYFPVCRAP